MVCFTMDYYKYVFIPHSICGYKNTIKLTRLTFKMKQKLKQYRC